MPQKSLEPNLAAPLPDLLPYTCAVRSQREGNPSLTARGHLSSTTTPHPLGGTHPTRQALSSSQTH